MFTGVSVEKDEQFREDLMELIERGDSKPLNEFLPGDWDTAHLIMGPTTKQSIEEHIGREVELRGDGVYENTFMEQGNLLILVKDGEIVRMVSTGYYPAFGQGAVSPRTILHGDPDAGRISLVEPDE